MASYYFRKISDGERVVARSLKDINAAAKREANKFGQAVQVFVDKAERGVGMKSHRQVMARNPAKRQYTKTYWATVKNGKPITVSEHKANAEEHARKWHMDVKPGYYEDGKFYLKNPIDFVGAIPEYAFGEARGHAKAAATSRARKPKRLAAHSRRGWLSATKAAAGNRKPFKVVAVKSGKSQTFKTMTLAEAKEIAEAMADNGFKATVSTND